MLVWGAYDFFVNVFEIRPSLVQICFRAIWKCVRWSCKFFSWHCSWQSPIRINSALDHNFTESQALPFAFIFEHVDCLWRVFIILCLLHVHLAEPPKYEGSHFERSKVWGSRFKQSQMWEPWFQMLKIMGALTSNDQKCGSSRSKCSKNLGALLLDVQKYGSSHLKR